MIRFLSIAIVASPYPLLDPHFKGRSCNNFTGIMIQNIDLVTNVKASIVITRVWGQDVPYCSDTSDKDPVFNSSKAIFI